MTAADLLPELDALTVVAQALADGQERALAGTLADMAGRLSAASASLQQLASGRDAQVAAALAGIARLRAEVAALAAQPATPGGVPAGGTTGQPAAVVVKPPGARSGLPWASGERHGNVYQAYLSDPASGLPAMEAARGRPVDFELVFVDGWKTSTAATWASACNPLKPASALPWLAARGIGVVLTIPLFPMGGLTGALPAGRQRFADVANGLYDAVHADLARRFAAYGVTVLGLRVGWECNSSYPWAHSNAEGDYSLWRQAYARVAGLWRAVFPAAPVALNFLRRIDVGQPDPSFTVSKLLQGDTSWFQALGADCYGNGLKAGATPADVKAYLNAGTPDRPLGPAMWAKAAAALGKWTEVSEWAAARPVYPADDPTRDTADFPAQMYDLFLSWPHLAWESYFRTDDLGTAASPGPGYHNLTGPMLPNTRAAYSSRWATAS